MIKKIRIFILFLGDLVILYLSLFFTLIVKFREYFNFKNFYEHLLPFTILYIFWIIIFYIFELYDLSLIKNRLELLSNLLKSLLISLIIGIIFFYTIPIFKITPKTNLLISLVFSGIFLFFWRDFLSEVFSNIIIKNLAILGDNNIIDELVDKIVKNPQLGYNFKGFLDPNIPILNQLKEKKIDVLIIGGIKNKDILNQLYKCILLKIDFIPINKAFEKILYKIPIESIDQNWFLENLREGEKKFYDKIKRVLDIIISILIICISFPIWILIALAIKLEDKGPVFYKQKRVGKDKKVFEIIKFRSMIKNAEPGKPIWAEKNDKRITKVGRLLRRYHLDELPQMINILKGDISLVGPRPERPEFVEALENEIPHYTLRHIIKPGFTGWAQIKFRYARSVLDSKEKYEYDLYYIKNRSFSLDIACLLRTIHLLFKGE